MPIQKLAKATAADQTARLKRLQQAVDTDTERRERTSRKKHGNETNKALF